MSGKHCRGLITPCKVCMLSTPHTRSLPVFHMILYENSYILRFTRFLSTILHSTILVLCLHTIVLYRGATYCYGMHITSRSHYIGMIRITTYDCYIRYSESVIHSRDIRETQGAGGYVGGGYTNICSYELTKHSCTLLNNIH